MTILEQFHQDEQRVLDRLVDGELSQSDRRELLAALDDEPGAWRRCALAFLESQTWRWQLSRLAAEPLLTHSEGAARPMPAQRGTFWGLCLGIAAGLLVAFTLGLKMGSPVLAPTGPSSEPIAESAPAAPAEELASEEPAIAIDPTEPGAAETIKLAAADGSDEIELPVAVAEDDEDNQDWLANSESPLSDELVEELKSAGLEVVRQRQFWPIDLSDGRRLVVPIEQVEIRQADASHYQ